MHRTHPRVLSRLLIRRDFYSSPMRIASWSTTPSPPKLPKEEQEIFERLQQRTTGAFSTPRDAQLSSSSDLSSLRSRINQSPESSAPSPQQDGSLSRAQSSQNETGDSKSNFQIQADGQGEELHPDVWRGAKPEFEGDTNPTTGEVGGPKNEPLRWGAAGDWSYNGRVTDF